METMIDKIKLAQAKACSFGTCGHHPQFDCDLCHPNKILAQALEEAEARTLELYHDDWAKALSLQENARYIIKLRFAIDKHGHAECYFVSPADCPNQKALDRAIEEK